MKSCILPRYLAVFFTCFALVFVTFCISSDDVFAGSNPKGTSTSKPVDEDPEEEEKGECDEDEEDDGESGEFSSSGDDPTQCLMVTFVDGTCRQICTDVFTGCIDFRFPFGSMPFFGGVGKGGFRLLNVKPSPELFSPDALSYHSVVGSWIRSDETNSGIRSFKFLDKLGDHAEFSFAVGAKEGFPQAPYEKSKVRARLVSASGAIVSNSPENGAVFLELVTSNGAVLRYDLESGDPISYKNTRGATITFAEVPEAIRTIVVRDGNVLRQVKSAEGVMDLVLLDDERGFEMRQYLPSQVGARGGDGRFGVTGDPVAVIRFENPTPGVGKYEAMDITQIVGTSEKKFFYRYSEALEDWSLEKGDGLWREEKALLSETDGSRVYERRLYDKGNNVISQKRFTEWTSPWGAVVLMEEINDYGGANLTKRYTYYTTKGENGYGKLKMVTYEDGAWKRLYYDSLGRTIRTETPYLDNGVRTAEFSYAPVDSRDTATPLDTRVRATTVKLNGIVVSRSWSAYVTNVTTGEVQEISEQAASQNAAYGDAKNRRSTVTYYAPNSGLFLAGRVKTREDSHGNLTSYTYTQNNGDASAFFVTTETQGAAASPVGVAGKTRRAIQVRDAQGRAVRAEQQVFLGGENFATLSAIEVEFSPEGLEVTRKKNGAIVRELVYDNRRVVLEKNAEGVETNFTYDELDKISQIVEKGTANRPDKITTVTRELGGIDCNCDSDLITTITAGDLSLSTRVKKDKVGRVTEETDTAGMITSYAYANGGLVTTIVRPNTATEVRENYLDGRLKSITGTGVLAQYYTYGVAADGSQWTRVHQASPNGARWSRSVSDFQGRTISNERPAFGGAVMVTRNFYDEKNRLERTEDSVEGGTAPTSTGDTLLVATRYFYNTLDEVTKTEITRGTVTNTSESDQNYVVTNGVVYRETWQKSDGLVVSRNRMLAGVAANPQLESESWSVGLPESNQPNFSWESATTATHSRVTFDRATQTRVTTSWLPTSSHPAITTAVGGLTQSSVSPSHGGETLYRYDALGRMIGVKQPRHSMYSEIGYNAQGQVTTSTDATGAVTTYLYYENGTVGAGQLRHTTNALGGTVFKEYDISGNETYTWGSATYPVVQGYDIYGQRVMLRTFRDANADFGEINFPLNTAGDTTTWIYDETTGALLQKTYADGYGPTYDYYADGQLKTRLWARTDANGDRLATNYTYTPQGQLAAITYSDTTPNVTYEYNTLGQQTRVTDGTGTRTFTYDAENLKLISENYLDGLHSGKILHRTYDTYGRETGYALVGGVGSPSQPENTTTDGESSSADETEKLLTAVTYTYDTHGRLNQVQGDKVPANLNLNAERSTLNATTFTYTRLPNSNLLATVTGPAHTVTNTYEPNRDVLTSKQNKTLSNVIVSQYDYTVNALGQRTTRTQSGAAFDGIGYADGTDLTSLTEKLTTTGGTLGTPGAGTSTDTFTYNTRSEVTGSTNNKDSILNRAYNYDPIGNRLTAAEGLNNNTKTYVSNALNQYTEIEKSVSSVVKNNPTYDLDGNMTSDGDGKTYLWDAENRLIQVTLANNEIVRYTYDVQSRRIKREHVTSVIAELTIYLYDDWNVIAEGTVLNSSFLNLKSYVWGLDLSGTHQGAGGVGGLLQVTDSAPTENENSNITTSYFYTYDANGNVSELLGTSESIQAHYEYDPFGKVTLSIGKYVAKNNYQFSTKPWNSSTNLNYYGYRFYSPEKGRWINRDPFKEMIENSMFYDLIFNKAGEDNLYGFLENSFGKIDLLGLKGQDEGTLCEKCGPDVSGPLKSTISSVSFEYWRLSAALQKEVCTSFVSASGWDIVGLKTGAYTKKCKESQTKKCKETVWVDGGCHYRGSVNYVLYGTMFRLCGKSSSWMVTTIYLYKYNAGNLQASIDWAQAGFNSWPAGSAPSADRKECKDCEISSQLGIFDGYAGGGSSKLSFGRIGATES